MDGKKEIIFAPFPKQDEFISASLSGQYGFIIYGGAIRGGKTYALLALFIFLCKVFPGSRWAIVRKDLPTIKQNLLPSWEKIKPGRSIKSYNQSTQVVTFLNGSQIIFFPESYDTDKELNRWRGLEVNGFGFEEINECQQATLFKAFERAGSYIIKNAKHQPSPLVVATCNPTQGWFKDLVYTPWKRGELRPNWLYIQSRIYDNTPLLEQQPDYLPSLKANLNHYEFEVFVEGNWDVQLQTGTEFLSGFNIQKHCKPISYNPDYPVHISLDNNVYPYIAVTVWQIIPVDGWIIKQVHEIPCKLPYNNAPAAGGQIVKWLNSMGVVDRVHLYGDYSTKNSSTIDINSRSFFQIIEETIRVARFRTVDKMLPHGSPASMADFINAIFTDKIKGLQIEINESCKTSINDYIATKRDKNGNIEKVVQSATHEMPSHQPHGHLTDTLKDFIVQAFNNEYKAFLNRNTFARPGGISQVPISIPQRKGNIG